MKILNAFICMAILGGLCLLALTVNHQPNTLPNQFMGSWTQEAQIDSSLAEVHWNFYSKGFQWSVYTADGTGTEFQGLAQGKWKVIKDTLILTYEDGQVAKYGIPFIDSFEIHTVATDGITRILYRWK